ncbi:MAG: GAF domain-containing protein [Candidatus Rokubacteria bacterium]|nr:GAF domain-containing protein [Candidatus Rokubacteria bacterium]MBI3827038.1 GAF domain-containing protein [Candidatus Rokubacteria bacterium]
MRRVLYPAGSRAAAAAASLLAGTHAVAELPAGAAPPDGHAVVLVDSHAAPGASAGVRVIALVSPHDAGPWPAHWYAVLPATVGREMLARAVDNAFVDLEEADEIRRLARELEDLNDIGISLSAERDLDRLLAAILTKGRAITRSDAGSIYLVEEDADGQHLRFALAQNDTIDIAFHSARLPLTSQSVSGHVALTGEILNLPDAYTPPAHAPYRINRAFDEQTGYRTKSMLVVPMKTPKDETIGVLQFINCKPDFRGRFRHRDEIELHTRPFSDRFVKLAGSLASQAAVAVDNSRLYESIRRLFEGFVTAAVTAIESRDPTTSGHSFRVADLCVGLAAAADRVESGPLREVRFAGDEMRELRYAALLHDFGKVGVREHVLVKAKKLMPFELERIRQRVAYLKRGLELAYTERRLQRTLEAGPHDWAPWVAALDKELAARLGALDEDLARVVMANEPAVLPQDVAAELAGLAERLVEGPHGERASVLTSEEAAILAIKRGSLTPEEYREIQSHVVHTIDFLGRIPWTRELSRVPEIAGAHHEKLNGTGYPLGRKADAIAVPSRIMTIADIYDALTALDRPYKKAIAPAQALDILQAERKAGALDGALLDLFIDARVYERQAP